MHVRDPLEWAFRSKSSPHFWIYLLEIEYAGIDPQDKKRKEEYKTYEHILWELNMQA